MKEKFNEAINYAIISSVLAFIIGLVLIIFPKISIDTIGIVVSTFIIVHGIVLIYIDIKATKYYIPYNGLLSGIISILLGIFLLCRPSILPIIFTVIIGIWMISSSINNIELAIKLCRTKLPWLYILILGIVDLIVGIIVIFNPFEATLSLALFSGIMLVVHSIITIVDMIIIKKDVKEISEKISEKLKNIEKSIKNTN